MPLIRVNNVELYYELHGPADAQTVVFINGLLTDTMSWAPTLPYFTMRYRCLVYDCRGQGRSEKPTHNYATPLHAADLVALLDALHIERPLVVGLSNGGAAALQVAAEHPERVAALVVCGTYAYVDTALGVKLQSWVRAMDTGGGALRFDVATPWVWGARFLNEHYERLLPFREKGMNLPLVAARNLLTGAMVHDVRALLPQISAPTLVVVGDEDVLTPPSYARAIVESVQRGRLHIMPGAGHAASLEQVEGFAELALAFFDEF